MNTEREALIDTMINVQVSGGMVEFCDDDREDAGYLADAILDAGWTRKPRDLEAETPSWEKEETHERVSGEGSQGTGRTSGGTRAGDAAGGGARTPEVRGIPEPLVESGGAGAEYRTPTVEGSPS